MPSINDKFGKVSISTHYAQATTVRVARQPGETVLLAFDLSKFANDTPVYFVTYRKEVDPQDPMKIIVVNQVSWKGIVNADTNTITELTLAPGFVDTGNLEGDYIECIPTAFWANSLIEGLRTSLNDDGTLKDSVVTTDKINNSAVTTAKLGDSQVTTAKINNLAVTTAKLANNSVTAAKIDSTDFIKRNNNGSVLSASNLVIESGYAVMNTGTNFISKDITFSSAFQSAPIVVASFAGANTSTSATYPSTGSNDVYTDNINVSATKITASGFNSVIARTSGATFNNGHRLFVNWIAIGQRG